MIAVGFDPSFIDTILTVRSDDHKLLQELPPPGHHHRNNVVTRIAGGNGVNIAYVLKKLGIDVKLVVPSDDLFDALLSKRGLQCDVRIHEEVNETVAVTWAPGEIQFNAVTAELSRDDWSRKVHTAWVDSAIKLSTNWGLNPRSVDWISCQILASSGWTYEQIHECNDLYQQALESQVSAKFVVETGSLKNHHDQGKLYQLLDHISSQHYDKVHPIILVNEEERVEFSALSPTTLIEHTASEILVVQQTNEIRYGVPPLECSQPNFVGAGDAFFAGIVEALVTHDRIDIDHGIEVAQQYICGKI